MKKNTDADAENAEGYHFAMMYRQKKYVGLFKGILSIVKKKMK